MVYVPVAHWVWGGGWLGAMGFRDFAGGAVVHVNAGVAALVAALVHRQPQRFSADRDAAAQPDDDGQRRIAAVGRLVRLQRRQRARRERLCRHGDARDSHRGRRRLARVDGLEWIKFGKPSVLGIVTGMVAGLGTITPASGYVGPIGALVDRHSSRASCASSRRRLMKRKLKIDDSLDVFPVHGVGGFTGLLLTAVFSATAFDGLGLPRRRVDRDQLLTQAIGALATVVWCAVATFVLLKLVNLVLPLRVTAEQENEGLDLVLHEERGYSL